MRLQIATVLSLLFASVIVTYFLTREITSSQIKSNSLRVELAELRAEVVARTEERWKLSDQAAWIAKLAENNPHLTVPPPRPEPTVLFRDP